jgi:hypothetical protein
MQMITERVVLVSSDQSLPDFICRCPLVLLVSTGISRRGLETSPLLEGNAGMILAGMTRSREVER